MTSEPSYLVVDHPDENRYVLERDGQPLGSSFYSRRDGVITITHTEVDPDQQDHGLGSLLAAGVLDDVRDGSEDRLVPQCPFIAHFVAEHPEYEDLLTR